VEIDIEDELHTHGDSRLTKVLLENLLSNAWKFTSKEERASIRVGRAPDPDGAFFIRDNGVGFDMKLVEKLFVPFRRLHGPAEFEGNGVGLSTAQRIVARHGGKIWVEAEQGHGATFYFTLAPGEAQANE
jgi:light-regulated signal transduction histidine kinase (bacteriophytochrome)